MGFATYVVVHILRSMKKSALREDISKIEAKMASYRIALKNRVKKKAKRFRATYPGSITTGEPIDISITQLSELPFEKNSDFQDYIELCKKINSFIDLANTDRTAEAANKTDNIRSDFMGTDFKNEMSIVRLINDLVTASKALNKQINRYNHFDHKARWQAPEPIIFASLFELQKVFKSKEIDEIFNEKPEEQKAA